jgi:hypothetical protein
MSEARKPEAAPRVRESPPPSAQRAPDDATAARIIREHYQGHLHDAVEQGPAAVREQIMIAMDACPPAADRLDRWFKEHLQKPPISYNTALYNRLHQAKEELKELLADAK